MERMKLQVLVSTMHQIDYSLLDKMNIQTDAIIVNQCDRNEFAAFKYKDHKVNWLSLNERGVGLSRNTALMRANGDILLFADDDVVYKNDYEEIVLKAFEKHKKADLIVFNLNSLNPNRVEFIVDKEYKLHWYNSLRFGACRIAVRRKSIFINNINYSLLFGGGAKYQSGEDNLFINDCLKKKLNCIATSENIGTVEQKESTWFNGYNEKYYFDRGALFKAMHPCAYWWMLLLIDLKNRSKNTELKFLKKYLLGLQGSKEFKRRGD